MSSKRNDHRVRDGLPYYPHERARIKAGLCYNCGAPRQEDGAPVRCRTCARGLVAYIRKLRRQRYEAGLCIDCGPERNNQGQRCVTCAAKISAATDAYRKRLAR